MRPWGIFLLCIAAAYGESCDNDHKKNEIIHKIDEYFKRHHHDQELLKHVLGQYIYPDMYMVDLGRDVHHLHEHPDHHNHHHHHHDQHTVYTTFGKRSYDQHDIEHLTKELEHLVKEMDGLNNACVLDIVYFVEGKLGLSHLGKTTVTTHAPPTTHAVHHTTSTTTTTTTKPPVTTTLPPLNVSHMCNGLEFVQAVAIGNTVLNPRAGLCTDGTHSQSEALVLNTCHADSPSTWKSGYNVMQNCDRIPRYTPIATFVFGMYSMDGSSMSGVFINCTPNGFKMAVQVCGHGPLIFEVQTGPNHSGRENPYSYYTVDW